MTLAPEQQIQVLHVDDEPSLTDLTATFLEREDDQFTVETANSAGEGLERIDSRLPDCIVSDYNMPGMNGIEFLQAVRNKYPDLPFILFTGKGSEAVASDAIAADVTDYLQKGSGTSQYIVLANRISNAVRATRSAAESEQRRHRLEQILKTVPGCVVQLNADGEFVFANERAKTALGLEIDELTDRAYNDSDWEIRKMSGEPIPDEELPFRQARDTGEPVFNVKHAIRWPDGTQKMFSVNAAPLFDETGTVESVVASLNEVTEQRERQRELRLLQQAIDGANVPITLADPSQPGEPLVYVNDAFNEMTGYPPDEALDRNCRFLQGEDTAPEKTAALREAIDNEDAISVELRNYQQSGDKFWNRLTITPIYDDDGSLVRYLGTQQDITERKERERQLTELNQASQDLLRAETRREVADIGVTAAKEILGLRMNAIHLSEADDTRLTPVAQTEQLATLLGNVRPLPVADSIAGRIYQRGEPTVIEDVREDPDVHDSKTDLRGHVYLPLADHGILIAGSEERAAFDQHDITFGTLLAGNLVAALDRIDHERIARQQEKHLSLFFEESALGAIQWDDEFRFERVNERAEEILGYDEETLRGRSWEMIVADEDTGQMSDAVEAFFALDDGQQALNKNVRKNGEVITCEWHNDTVTDEDGNIQSVFSEFQDVTDRERRKTDLQEHKTIIEALSDAVYVIDEEGRFTYVNDEFVELVGYDRDTILGNTPSLIKDEEAVEQAEQQLGQLLSSDGPETVAFEVTVHPREGEPIICEDHMGVIPYDGEEFDGSVGTLRDITQRKKREQELQKLKGQYETLAKNFPDGIVLLFDSDLRYVQTGGQELPALDLIPGEIKGATPRDLFPEKVAENVIQYQRDTLDGVSHAFEQEYGGEQYRIQTVPVRTSDEDIAYGMAVSQNITERTERRRELERQNERLAEFASIVSHDLRNPLQVARGRMELVREEHESDHITSLTQALDRMNALIEDLLTLAREGEQVNDTESVDLANVARSSWQTVSTAQATLETDTSQAVEADQSRLRQLFENLYCNAVEHGGDRVKVVVGAIDDGFYVADTGPGIDESDREEVFEAGYSTIDEGTGFGLQIVKKVAEAHGWEIAVTEGDRGGARFEVTGVEPTNR